MALNPNASFTRLRPGWRDPPETRRPPAANEEDGRVPFHAGGGASASSDPVILDTCLQLRSERDAGRYQAGLDVSPEGDQQLASDCDDGDPPRASLQSTNACSEPGGEFAAGLIAQPQPGELDQSRALGLPARLMPRSRSMVPLLCGVGTMPT